MADNLISNLPPIKSVKVSFNLPAGNLPGNQFENIAQPAYWITLPGSRFLALSRGVLRPGEKEDYEDIVAALTALCKEVKEIFEKEIRSRKRTSPVADDPNSASVNVNV
jgi:hypothetical protein